MIEQFIGYSFLPHLFSGSFLKNFRFYFFFKIHIFSFLIHLLINKQLWLKSNEIYNRIKTSFIQSKLVTHVRRITWNFVRPREIILVHWHWVETLEWTCTINRHIRYWWTDLRSKFPTKKKRFILFSEMFVLVSRFICSWLYWNLV